MTSNHVNNYPKLHNAAWPGVAGLVWGVQAVDLGGAVSERETPAAREKERLGHQVVGVVAPGWPLLAQLLQHRLERLEQALGRSLAESSSLNREEVAERIRQVARVESDLDGGSVHRRVHLGHRLSPMVESHLPG